MKTNDSSMVDPCGCVNLHQAFPCYRPYWEVDSLVRRSWKQEDRPWLMEFRGKHGLIHPHGGVVLTAVVFTPQVAARLQRSGLVKDVVGGRVRNVPKELQEPFEIRLWFDVSDFEHFAAALRLRKRRHSNRPKGVFPEHLRLYLATRRSRADAKMQADKENSASTDET